MRGTVHDIHQQRGMVAIATVSDGFTIIELLNEIDIEIGDVYEWSPDTGCGHQMYNNLTKKKHQNVFVQDHWVPSQQLRQQLLYPEADSGPLLS